MEALDRNMQDQIREHDLKAEMMYCVEILFIEVMQPARYRLAYKFKLPNYTEATMKMA